MYTILLYSLIILKSYYVNFEFMVTTDPKNPLKCTACLIINKVPISQSVWHLFISMHDPNVKILGCIILIVHVCNCFSLST